MNSSSRDPIVVIGAGLAGLCCARRIQNAGLECVLIEAGDRIGGRIATEVVDGFRLDVGFQVLLTAYPEAQEQLDYEALGLRAFRPGSLVRFRGRTIGLSDPRREPLRALRALFSKLMSPRDAIGAARLSRRLLRDRGDLPGTAAEVLDSAGISRDLRRGFFEPFFSGVTLDPELSVPGDYFAFLFRMFAQGDAALPAGGMGAIPAQLARALPADTIRLGCRAREIGDGFVILEDGSRLAAAAVAVATDGDVASELTECAPPTAWNGTTTIYFGADQPPIRERLLMLNGTGEGPIHHVCVPNIVQPTYAPAGRSLVSVSVLGVPGEPNGDDSALVGRVREQLSDWFGAVTAPWRWLRTYQIPRAQPRLPHNAPGMTRTGVARLGDNLVVCGDHLATPSIQGAMMAGRRAAEALLEAEGLTAD